MTKPNAKCPCNSGKKYKKCCRKKERLAETPTSKEASEVHVDGVDEEDTVGTVEVDKVDLASMSRAETLTMLADVIALKRRNGEDETGDIKDKDGKFSLAFFLQMGKMYKEGLGAQAGIATVQMDMVRKLTKLELAKIRACGEDVFASGSISDHIQMIISNVRIDYEQLALGELSEELAKEIAQMTTTEIMYGAGTSDESGMPRPSNPVGEFPRRETDPLLRAMNSSKPREATHKCAYTQCEIVKEGLLRCGGCTSVHYCSAEHQKLHWDVHKTFCVSLKHIKKHSKKMFQKKHN